MKNYDTFIIGELCIDEIAGFDGTSEWSIGGAVVYSSYSALAGGNRVGILIKSSAKDKMMPYILPVHNDDIYWRESASGTSSIRNVWTKSVSGAPPPPWLKARRLRLQRFRTTCRQRFSTLPG